jgi:hypothetical protein
MSKFKFKKSYQIGSPDAETDELLLNAFIQVENLTEMVDTRNQKSILLGRTGSGKSAIIRYIKNNLDNVQEIVPEAMSLRFLSNSTILKYFNTLGVNLNLFYKVLWKHIFIVELLKMYFDDETSSFKKKSLFERLRQKIQINNKKNQARKEKAIKYMENWSNDFWQQTEVLIKTFENSIREKFAQSVGMDIDFANLDLSNERFKDQRFVYEAKQKAESIISSSQVVELLDLIDIMKSDLFTSHQKKFYLVIDDLDKEWIDDTSRLELIGAMIDVIKEFRQLQGVKIMISLRENLNEIVFSKHDHKGNQREKIKPLYSNLTWASHELKDLIDKRLRYLSEDEFDVKEAFYESRRGHKKGFDYIVERTYYRPRDVISFFNHMIENANNKSVFTNDIIAKAEPSYSLERFQALEDEWSENFGRISLVCDFLKGINNGFRLKSVQEEKFADIFLEEKYQGLFKGDLSYALQSWKAGEIGFTSFLKKLIFILYRTGIIGIKKGPTYPTAFYYTKEVIIERSDVSNSCKFYVHPALYSFLKVNVIDQLPEGN